MEDGLQERLQWFRNGFYVITMSFGVLLHINENWKFSIHWMLLLLGAVLCYGLGMLVDQYKKITGGIFVVFFIGISAFLYGGKGDMLLQYEKVGRWFREYLKTGENYLFHYAFVVGIIGIVVITFLFYIVEKHKNLRYGLCLLLSVIFIYYSIQGIVLNKISLGIFLFHILAVVVEVVNGRVHSNLPKKQGIVAFYMMPICIFLAVIVTMFPSKSQPIQWKTMNKIRYAIVDKVGDWNFQWGLFSGNRPEDFQVSFEQLAQSQGDTLGGEIKKENQLILQVRPTTKAKRSTYLIGGVRDTYTASGWKRSLEVPTEEDEPSRDLNQMLYGMYREGVKSQKGEEIFHNLSLYINYKNIRTKSIFYPLKTYDMEVEKDRIFVEKESPTLLTNEILGRGFSYKVSFLEANYESETMVNFLRKISSDKVKTQLSYGTIGGQDEEYLSYVKEVANLNKGIVPPKEDWERQLKSRRDAIYQYYTQVPKEIPERVWQLAKRITKEYDNDYDRLKALETFLSTYHYTLSPREKNGGQEFVDYFLFEGKEGYCTYFATAMSILSRCIQIPTRYVEGVVVNYEQEKDRYYLVGSRYAHAWTEAYIDGFGWVPFEATPAMYEDRYENWTEVDLSLEEVKETQKPQRVQVEKSEEKIEKSIHKKRLQEIKYASLMGLLILLVLFLLFVGVVLAVWYNGKRKYGRGSLDEKIGYRMEGILHYLSFVEPNIMVGETLEEYVKKLGTKYDVDEVTLREVCAIYMSLRYGQDLATEKNVEKVNGYYEGLRGKLKRQMGIRRWWKAKIGEKNSIN